MKAPDKIYISLSASELWAPYESHLPAGADYANYIRSDLAYPEELVEKLRDGIDTVEPGYMRVVIRNLLAHFERIK